jgi:hypothetical protein
MLSLKGQQRFLCRTLLLCLFVFLLAACGGGDEGGSSAMDGTTVPEACTLLSAADTEPVLGSSVASAGTVAEDGLRSNCTWQDEISGATLMLNIWAAGDTGDGWASQFLSAQVAGGENVPVENLGEEGYAIVNEDFSNYYWRVDDAFVVVLISTANEASQDMLLELARKIDDGF